MLPLTLALVVLGGCNPPQPLAETSTPPVRQDHDTMGTVIAAPPQKVASVMEGINDFTFRLVQATGTTEDKNVLISPFSVSTAVSMVVPGAHGEDQKTLLGVLAPGMSASELKTGTRDLFQKMRAAKGEPLKIASSAWIHRKMPFNPAYAKELSEFYGSEIRSFEADPASAREINDWVKEKTKERISAVVDKIMPGERLILVNAIAFDGLWKDEFATAGTRPQTFHRLDGKEVQVPMMHALREAPYLKSDELRAVRLDYQGDDFSMLLMLPEAGKDAGAMLRGLSASKLREILQRLAPPRDVAVTLPKFTFTDEYNLVQPLSEMGLANLFTRADLSGVSPELAQGAISRVVHKTFIDVDEKGTKAAAATAMSAKTTSTSHPDWPLFVADRPFGFLILHRPTSTILFAGVVNDPTLGG